MMSVPTLLERLKDLVSSNEAPAPPYHLAAGQPAVIEAGRSGAFKAKVGGKAELTPDRLRWMASNFDGARDHLLKIGHGEIDTATPDYGRVTALAYDEGRDRLLAHAVPTESLIEKNRKGEFRRVSMELSRTSDGNFVFDHLAFLGAHRPAISGLAPVELASGEIVAEVFLAEGDEETEILLAGPPKEQKPAPTIAENSPLDPHGTLTVKEPVQEKTLMADEAQVKKLEDENKKKTERLVQFAAKDVEMFLASDAAVKRIPLAAIKSGNAKKLLAALATMEAEGEGPVVKFAAADGNDTEGSLYELAKTVLLSLPEKITKDEGTERAKDGDDGETPADLEQFAGADPDSVKDHRAAERLMFAAKSKGETLTYFDALRQVEMARSK